ncbi:leucine-rich repeat-containing protein 45-like [Neocloeon triangulifer]|uniref:leucine-rich repeat-containing protein 45-like n=1 Tax=Neocloeon triangulifer TaxID=2078957 RepID=UPI00286ED482|nr:leucine-rich repeat-containing protein 45-like [Neocloeon triangulifer]XP_059472104.1 leucine-rich repeat-containing protein 45-like [Neocloeon triangulifer]
MIKIRICLQTFEAMACLREEYLNLCEQLNIEPEPSVKKALKVANVSGCLSLKGDTSAMSVITCQILAKIIANSQTLSKLDFSNCMPPQGGFADLMNGVEKNKSVRELDLSSNNLQAGAALQLAKYLRLTSSLERIFLQWNSLGQGKDAFAIFCESLGANQSLQELDLRNNSLTEMSTEDLVRAIKANKSLKAIDLRWNQLGPGEGRVLLQAIQDSPRLTCIQLDGNLFNSDLTFAIEMAASHNADMIQLAQEWEVRCNILTRHTSQLEKRDEKRASGVRYLLQQQGQKLNVLNKEQKNEMIKVEEQLYVNRRRLDTMESLVLDKEEQIETLQEMNKSIQEDRELERTELAEQLNLLRDQLTSAQNLIHNLKLKMQEQEAETKGLQLENSHLKDGMMLHNSKCEDVIKAAEERAMSAIKNARQEKAHAEEEIKKMQKGYEEKLKKLDALREEMEKRSQAQNQTHLEALTAMKSQLQEREEKNMASWKSEKAELKSALEKCKSHLDSLQKVLQTKTDDLGKCQVTIAELKQVVAKEQEKNEILNRKLEDAARQREEAESLKSQISSIQSELTSLRNEKDSQIKQLAELVATQEKHFADLRFGEAERTGILCSAVSQYIAKVGASVGTSEH